MSKPVIVCVDDEKFVLDGLRTALMQAFGDDYVVEIAEDGKEALGLVKDLLANRQEVPVVISDYVMPDMKGDELLKHIRILSQRTLKIMLTGQANVEGVTKAVNEADLYRYIAKPWNNEHLIGVIRQAIGEYLSEKQEEDRNQALLRAMPDLVVLLARDGRVLDVHGPDEALPRPRAEILGQPVAEVVSPALAITMVNETPDSASPGYVRTVAYDLVVRGEPRHFEARLAACDATSYVAVIRDLTVRKRLEEEHTRLLAQARHDARAKSDLLCEVNHRVKNNLTAILGLLLRERKHTPAEGRAFVESALGHLNHRIHGLLEVHQMLSDSQWAPVGLSELAGRVIRAATAIASGDKRLELDVPTSPVIVSPRQAGSLALVFNELATNSLKHALGDRPSVRIAVRVVQEGAVLDVEFRDDGPGYPPEVLRDERVNVGLGLVRELATESLRGRLTLATDRGAVARFTFAAEESDRT
jgi:two-component sensor histidine kinase